MGSRLGSILFAARGHTYRVACVATCVDRQPKSYRRRFRCKPSRGRGKVSNESSEQGMPRGAVTLAADETLWSDARPAIAPGDEDLEASVAMRFCPTGETAGS